MKNDITQTELKQWLTYVSETGNFTWAKAIGRKIRVGDAAGSVGSQGYRYIKIAGSSYRASRLAWLYVYGEWPTLFTDHINRVRADDRIANLRQVTNTENIQNTVARSNSASGVKGVYFHTRFSKWVASIRASGKRLHFGYFKSVDEANTAYQAAAAIHHTHSPLAVINGAKK